MHELSTRDVHKSLKPFFVAWSIAVAFYAVVSQTVGKALSFQVDLRSFYAAGLQIRTNPAGLYDLVQQQLTQDSITPWLVLPFDHPAYEALLFAPFTLLPYRGAYLAFTVFNLIVLMASFLILRETFSVTLPIWQPRPGLMFFPFLPLIVAIFEGQDSIVSFFICCLAWRCLERERITVAGLVLSLGLFKFNLVLPIVLVLVAWKGWRLAAGFAAGATLVVLSCLGLVGRAATTSYLDLLRTSTLASSNALETQRALGIFPVRMPNLYGLVYVLGHTRLSPHVLVGITSALSAVVLCIACLAARRLDDGKAIYSVAILSALLVSHHLLIHDLTLLLLPIALLHRYSNHTIWTSICFATVPLLVFFFQSDAFFLLSLPILAAFLQLTIRSRKAFSPAFMPSRVQER